MAFDLSIVNGYGTGELGDVTDPTGQINTTALIDLDTYTSLSNFHIKDKNVGIYGDFEEGMEVLIQIAGMSSDAPVEQISTLSLWAIASISSIDEDGTFELYDEYSFSTRDAIEDVIDLLATSRTIVTITSIPQFRNLTLNSGCTISPRQDFPLAFKCSGTLTLNGGHIDLRNKGLTSPQMERPTTLQEENGTLDTDKYAGWENSQTKNRFIMNAGDGAAYIIAKKLGVQDNSSRIGNPTLAGVQFCRGSTDSRAGTPTNATNIGGSTILLVAGTIENFTPAIIAKYRTMTASEISAGQVGYNYRGLCRCYIASDTRLRNDEGLYAYDGISNENRLTSALNVHDFGDGSSGSFNATSQVNNYASVTAVDETGQVFTVSNKTTNGTELFAVGTLVMVHCSSKANTMRTYHGRFFLAKILGINGNDITLDTAASGYQKDVTNYQIQLVTIPRFTNFTLNGEYTAVPKFATTDANTGTAQGGIFAIAVSGTCDISDGQINVEGKGGAARYGSAGLEFIGNAQNRDKLPIGEGHGSVFILANKLVMNDNTRIGATYSGAIGEGPSDTRNYFGGAGTTTGVNPKLGGGYSAVCVVDSKSTGNQGGWGGGAGQYDNLGGYGSNGKTRSGNSSGSHGAHIMIIADTITGFNMAAISTGGGGAKADSTATITSAGNGSAGYGGGGAGTYNGGTSSDSPDVGFGGGYNGGGGGDDYYGGGGASGWAFIYCNNATNQNTDNIIL